MIRTSNFLRSWLAQRPPTTTRAYLLAWRYLVLATGGKNIQAIQLQDLQAFVQSLRGLKPSSQVTFIAAIQSLFSFACRIGYTQVNVGALLRRPKVPANVAERIVTEADIQRLLTLITNPRDAILLRLAYVSGLRVTELAGLRWKSFAPRSDGAVLSVVGKGSRLRHVFLPEPIWAAVSTLHNGCHEDAPVFLSRHRKPLSVNSMHRIVKQAAHQAGLPASFSMHWCRHAHASHAMDRGAPVHLVQQTLGHVSLATTCRYVHCKPGTSSAQYIAGIPTGSPLADPSSLRNKSGVIEDAP